MTVKASLDGMQTPVDIADTFYGTHFGDLQGWVQGCYASRGSVQGAHTRAPDSPTAPRLAPGAEKDRDKKNRGRLYATYTKLNMKTGRYYSGRTSMVVDLGKPLDVQAEQAVDSRDANHHVDENDEPKTSGFLRGQLHPYTGD